MYMPKAAGGWGRGQQQLSEGKQVRKASWCHPAHHVLTFTLKNGCTFPSARRQTCLNLAAAVLAFKKKRSRRRQCEGCLQNEADVFWFLFFPEASAVCIPPRVISFHTHGAAL